MEEYWKDRAAAYALSRIYVYEPRVPKAILDNMGSASMLFCMDRDSVDEVLGPYNRHKERIRSRPLEAWAEELGNACRDGWSYLAYCDGAFPPQLLACEDSPLGLFIKGDDAAAAMQANEYVSVIGTRDLSSYGREWCQRVVGCLADSVQRPVIVSGLAFGVDIEAHKTALGRSLPTIAVMATGTDSIYPRQHEIYARRIAGAGASALVTEYPPGAGVTAASFLCRNRIIAGLSRATVLVESRLKGGGMSTARMASSYSRDVFAIPGRNDDLRSQGCNMLIHSHLAEPLVSCEEFLKSLGYKPSPDAGKDAGGDIGTVTAHGAGRTQTDRMMKLVLAIRAHRDMDAHRLARATGLGISDILADLCLLENDGIICSDLLGRYSIKKG